MCVCVVECERERVVVHVLGVFVEGFTERLMSTYAYRMGF